MPTIITAPFSTSDLTSKQLEIDIAKKIGLLDPNANPATWVTAQVASRKAKQPVVSHDLDEYRPSQDRINKSAGYLAGDTELVVDNPSYFKAGDIWEVFDSYEQLYVVEGETNPITVIRNFPGVTSGQPGYPTALVDNDWLLFRSNVISEGGLAVDPIMTQAVQHDNYVQFFSTTFELTETEMASLHNTEAPLPYETAKKAVEHEFKHEYAFFFGAPSASQVGTNGKLMRTLGGARWFILRFAPSGNSRTEVNITKAEFEEWLQSCFRYGSKEKWLYAPPLIMSAINYWWDVRIQISPGEKRIGLNVSTWESPHGILHLVNHKLLEGPNPGTVGGWAFLLDHEEIEAPALISTKLKTNIQVPRMHTHENEYYDELTYTFGQFSHHGLLRGFTSYS